MSLPSSRVSLADAGFASACDRLEAILRGSTRRDILDQLERGADRATALRRLRAAMRLHVFRTSTGALELDRIVHRFDALTRREGIHVLLEWHEVAYRFIEDEIPVVLLDSLAALDEVHSEREALALLLDFYFTYVLALFVMRAWDEGDPGANLDRVTALLRHLRGPGGSGIPLVESAETLLFIAVSTFEPDDLAYHRLLARVRSLDAPHRLRLATACAPLMGCHLRWGLPALYEHDLGRMRADNFIDYPWLFFAVSTCVRGYAERREAGAPAAELRELAGAILNGLSADPAAFLGTPPASLASVEVEHAETRALLRRYREALVEDFGFHRPDAGRYSPLGFHFNFPHNVLFAMATVALTDRGASRASLDELLSGAGAGSAIAILAQRLTRFAAANPELRGDRSVLGLYHDPSAGRAAFAQTLRAVALSDGALSSRWD